MFVIKLLRKFGKLIRGGAAKREIVLGAVLGFVLGMVPGFNLTTVLMILVILILNGTMGLTLLGLALGKLASFALAPLTFKLGFFLIHGIGLEGLFRAASDTPVLALLDLHVYCLVGGLIPGVILGTLFGRTVGGVVMGIRRALINADDRSERFRKLAENKAVKLFIRLTFGKQKQGLTEIMEKEPRLFRKGGVILVATMVVILGVAEFALLDRIAGEAIRRSLEAAVGAQVDIASTNLSVLSGELECMGIEVTDPAQPERNIVLADRLSGDVSVRELLTKRFVVDSIVVGEVTIHAQRQSPGIVYRPPAKDEPEAGDDTGLPPLLEYFEKAKEWKPYLDKAREWLKKTEQEAEAPAGPSTEDVMAQRSRTGYLGMSAQELLARRPTWVIRNVSIEKIRLPAPFGDQALVGREFSSHPAIHAQTTDVTMTPLAGGDPTVRAAIRYGEGQGTNDLAVRLPPFPVAGIVSGKAPVLVEKGNAVVEAKGTFGADLLALPFELKVTDLALRAKEGESVLGLSADQANDILGTIAELTLTGEVAGTLSSPRLRLDKDVLGDALKSAAGDKIKSLVRKEADEKTEELRKKADEKAEELRKKAGDKLGDGLRKLF